VLVLDGVLDLAPSTLYGSRPIKKKKMKKKMMMMMQRLQVMSSVSKLLPFCKTLGAPARLPLP
jgi:hypothetical protein